MESSDFIERLGADVSIKILMCLEDPSDLIRVSAVSSSCRQFVIANGICKELYKRMFPEITNTSRAIGISNVIEPLEFRPSESPEWTRLMREHRVYSFLTKGLASVIRTDCISEAICASSTDNYPEESIQNTLEPGDRIGQRASYWSSKGESDPATPERLTYRLTSTMCVITEINVQPFQAYFPFGFPIYSAKAIRFLMGHPKVGKEAKSARDGFSTAQESCHEEFVWTYVSPEFPMAQENCLQKFKLPEPVICIGGILQVELLGRSQKAEMDGLYYICISHVEVVGRPLSAAFDVEVLDQTGKCRLKYKTEHNCWSSNRCPQGGPSSPPFHSFSASIRGWEQMILNTLLGAGAVVLEDDDDSDDEYLS